MSKLHVKKGDKVLVIAGKDKGKIMKELMPKVKGKAEGSVVNKIVGEFLQ